MKYITFLLVAFSFLRAVDIPDPNGVCESGEGLILTASYHFDSTSSCSYYEYYDSRTSPPIEVLPEQTDDYIGQAFHYGRYEWVHVYNRHAYGNVKCSRDYKDYSCEPVSCPNGQSWNYELQSCEAHCPTGADYNATAEECQCFPGYDTSYDANGTLVCIPPSCPDMFDSLPLFKVADSVADCNFFQLSDGSALTRPDGKICCYGQPALDDNSSCPPDNIEINGECYPITDNPDENDTDPKDCPMGQYWSFMENECLPFFPDDNSTDSGGSDGSGGTSGDSGSLDPNQTVSTLTNADLFGGEMSTGDYSNDLTGYTTKAYDSVRKLLDSYVLVKLPVNVSGSCSNELVQSFSILGRSYTVNLTSWFQKINEFNSFIYALVMFIFGITGVIIVASGRSD